MKAGLAYATKQEGPFYRVAREGLTPGSTNPLRSAQKYVEKVLGRQYVPAEVPESSLAKQSGIARVHSLGVEDSPQYRSAVFDAYAKKNPQMMRQHGIKNYDDLLRKSYGEMAKETKQQFESLPVRMSFHRAGEGNYPNSGAMIDDVTQRGHLNVFQGGDPHDFLNAVDPRTGLNSNEMFRAVHDFYGHGIKRNPFGPKGEEVAWGAHQPMYTDLARPAMTAETRGQNSLVNYSPLNATMKAELLKVDEAIHEARRYGRDESLGKLLDRRREIMDTFQYAPQKSLILPPEFNEPGYLGGIPDYMQGLITPRSGTATSATLTHYSPLSNLTTTDPRMYGRGIAGAEAERVRLGSGPKDRTYFYPGELGARVPEAKLGPYGYRAESDNLYDIQKDPEKLNLLSRVSNTRPYTAEANRGVLDASSAQNDMERLVKEYGYEGYLNPSAEAAAVFYPKPVTRVKAEGGSIQHLAGGGKLGALGALVKQGIKKFAAPQDEALRLAQQRAALPVKKGGLGLPADNTPAQRADVMFPVEGYHGTNKSFPKFLSEKQGGNFDEFDGAFPRDGFWTTTDPSNASWYAGVAARNAEGTGANVMPLRLAMPKPHRVSAKQFAEEGEYSVPSQYDAEKMGNKSMIVERAEYPDSIPVAEIFREGMAKKYGSYAPYSWNKKDADKYYTLLDVPPEIQHTHNVAFDPDNIRSRFAAFDPFRRDAATAAALGVAAPDLLANEKAKGGSIQHLAGGGAAWQRAEGKSKSGGLNAVGRAKARAISKRNK